MSLETLKATSRIDLNKLKTYSALYEIAHWYIGPNGEVDADKIPKDIAERLDGWLVINYSGTPQPQQRTHGFGVQPQQSQPAPPQQHDLEQPVRSHAGTLDEWIRSRSRARSAPQPARPVAPVQPVVQLAPVVTTPPPPQVRRLSNGEPELALNASVVEMRAASKIQLQDLSRRRGEGRQQHLGRFAGRF